MLILSSLHRHRTEIFTLVTIQVIKTLESISDRSSPKLKWSTFRVESSEMMRIKTRLKLMR
jgi:hypothetical protein